MFIDNLVRVNIKLSFINAIKQILFQFTDPKEIKLFTTSSNSSRVYKIWKFKNMFKFNKNKKIITMQYVNIITK